MQKIMLSLMPPSESTYNYAYDFYKGGKGRTSLKSEVDS